MNQANGANVRVNPCNSKFSKTMIVPITGAAIAQFLTHTSFEKMVILNGSIFTSVMPQYLNDHVGAEFRSLVNAGMTDYFIAKFEDAGSENFKAILEQFQNGEVVKFETNGDSFKVLVLLYHCYKNGVYNTESGNHDLIRKGLHYLKDPTDHGYESYKSTQRTAETRKRQYRCVNVAIRKLHATQLTKHTFAEEIIELNNPSKIKDLADLTDAGITFQNVQRHKISTAPNGMGYYLVDLPMVQVQTDEYIYSITKQPIIKFMLRTGEWFTKKKGLHCHNYEYDLRSNLLNKISETYKNDNHIDRGLDKLHEYQGDVAIQQ